jgi:hypothetical protein
MEIFQLRTNSINAIQFTGSISNIEEIKSILKDQYADDFPPNYNNSNDPAELYFFMTPQDKEMGYDTSIESGDYILQASNTYFIPIKSILFNELFIKS